MVYYILNKQRKQEGPYTILQLRGLDLKPADYVWARGWRQWQHAKDVEELRLLVLDYKPTAIPTPPPAPVEERPAPVRERQAVPAYEKTADTVREKQASRATAQQTSRAASQQSKGQEKKNASHLSTRWKATAIIIVALICVLNVTNPNVFAHRKEIRPVLTMVSPEVLSSGLPAQAANLGAISLVDKVFQTSLVYHNFYLFSTTSASIGGHSRFLSFGILGHVFTVGSESLE